MSRKHGPSSELKLIRGMLPQADLNGKEGRLGPFFPDTGRYTVTLDTFRPGTASNCWRGLRFRDKSHP